MHAQIKTLTLMAAVLAAIVVYAVIPKEVTLGSYTLKKITFSSILHHAPQVKNAQRVDEKSIETKLFSSLGTPW